MADTQTLDTDKQLAERSKHNQRLSQVIKTFWSALLRPNWSYNDLVALGKAVFAKQGLESIDQATFDRIIPHLQSIATDLVKYIDQEQIEKSKESTDAG